MVFIFGQYHAELNVQTSSINTKSNSVVPSSLSHSILHHRKKLTVRLLLMPPLSCHSSVAVGNTQPETYTLFPHHVADVFHHRPSHTLLCRIESITQLHAVLFRSNVSHLSGFTHSDLNPAQCTGDQWSLCTGEHAHGHTAFQ